MEQRIALLEQQMREHTHNGFLGGEIDIKNIRGTFRTITVAADLTKILAAGVTRLADQIVIDTTTGTKKLYVYDTVGAVWRSCTIS
jgi:hypothetical protein